MVKDKRRVTDDQLRQLVVARMMAGAKSLQSSQYVHLLLQYKAILAAMTREEIFESFSHYTYDIHEKPKRVR